MNGECRARAERVGTGSAVSTLLRAQRSNPSIPESTARHGLLRCARNDAERPQAQPRRVGKGAKRRAHHPSSSTRQDGGLASLSPHYGCCARCDARQVLRRFNAPHQCNRCDVIILSASLRIWIGPERILRARRASPVISSLKRSPSNSEQFATNPLLQMIGDCAFPLGFNVDHRPAKPPPMSQFPLHQDQRRGDLDLRQRRHGGGEIRRRHRDRLAGADLGGPALLGRRGRHRHHLAGGAGVRPAGRRGTSLRPRQVREPVGARSSSRCSTCWPAASWSNPGAGCARAQPPPTLSAIPFVVLVIDIAVNFWRARALHRTARETQSQALAADALHFASDVLGSIAVIIGLVLTGLGFGWGDSAAAIAVAVMISILGLRLGRSTIETLLDRAPRRRVGKGRRRDPRSARRGRRRARCACAWSGRRISSTPSPRCRAPTRSIASRRSRRPRRKPSARCSATPTSPSPRCRSRATMRACASASW